MRIQLSDHFTYKRLLRFALPSIVMMIFTSVYGVVDGLFVSNYVGKTPFAALNLIMPVLMMLGGIGFMIGTGGSAIVSKFLGMGQKEKANEAFSMLIYVTIVSGVAFSILGLVFLRPLSVALGAQGDMLEYCVLYGRILLISMTAFLLQNVFQSFFIAAEKPQLGLTVTLAAGCANMILDYLFVAIFQWGLAGAAIATAVSQIVGSLFPMIYFARENPSLLRLGKARLRGKILLKACTNGSSELMTNISMSLVNVLYNFQLINMAGEDGVAAYGVIMYANFVFIAIFIGYSLGSAPIVSYHYGADNQAELKNLFRKSLAIVIAAGLAMVALSEGIASPLTGIFVGYDPGLHALTLRGFQLFSLSFLVTGVNIFASAFFTALNNGAVSAAISFLRTLVFQVAAVFLLPLALGEDGIWLAAVAAELLALAVSILCFIKKKSQYQYA